MNKKYFSIDEIQKKLEYYCSYQERCHSEVFNKIMTLTTNIGDANNIITKLIDDGYLNETRFCKEYTIGKFKHKNWGKNRIISELKKRKISNRNIEMGLDEIDEDIYIERFNELFDKQLERHASKNDMYTKKKIFDYFNYRGWEKDLIFKKINKLS